MPTYQYACTSCGHRFEAVQAFTEDSLTTCPVCAGQLRKVYGSVGVVFKGSGFYRTDSRNGKTAATTAAGADAKSDKSAAKSDSPSSSSESKPAASASSAGSSAASAPTKAAS